jgi:hypothetical protein
VGDGLLALGNVWWFWTSDLTALGFSSCTHKMEKLMQYISQECCEG